MPVPCGCGRPRLDEIGDDRVTGRIELGPEHQTPWGIVHGGVYTSAIESAAASGQVRQWLGVA